MLSNAANHSLARSTHNVRVAQEEWVLSDILYNIFVLFWLADSEVGARNDEAICRHFVTWLK